MSNPIQSTAPRRAERSGDRHAARAIALLGRWSRAAHWHLTYSGPCACCVGDAQRAHLERQAIGARLDQVGPQPGLAALLERCRASSTDDARPLGELMRAIATERDAEASAEHAILLTAFETLLDSMEEA